MIYPDCIVGHFSKLRYVKLDDAKQILKLRLDENLNRYINKVDNDVEKQRCWIDYHQKLEGDYYFVIEDINNNLVGTVSIYNISENEGELGRWVSKANSIINLESIILAYDFAFDILKLDKIWMYVIKDNTKVVKFHKVFGSKCLGENLIKYKPFEMIEFCTDKELYKDIRKINIDIINKFLKE